ncbi:MAG: GNAT family N-acetyltransferase [Clostridia bacterium]|nr:GNAT family N-acetyltransferase [Clostridia bacterium]
MDEKNNSIELSFNLHPNYSGNEYIKEATIEVLHYLFQIGFAYVLCGYDEGNKKSRRVIEKIGFKEHSVIQNSWNKNGLPITTYTCILSKKIFMSSMKKNL